MRTRNPVIIAGGGIGGLATALTLHQIGVPCVVFEAVREMRPLGVGINLQPNAVRELYDLGITADELGRVGLRSANRVWPRNERPFVSVGKDGRLGLDAAASRSETFQWIETFTGEVLLMSLTTHRYVRADASDALIGDSPGPHPNGRDDVRWLAVSLPE